MAAICLNLGDIVYHKPFQGSPEAVLLSWGSWGSVNYLCVVLQPAGLGSAQSAVCSDGTAVKRCTEGKKNPSAELCPTRRENR